MKQPLIEYLRTHLKARFVDLSMFLSMKNSELVELLNYLVEYGEIIFENDAYFLPETVGLLRAEIVSVKDHFAFAEINPNGDDLKINAVDLHGAMLGDIVFVRHQRYADEVVKIVRRRYQELVGEVESFGPMTYLKVKGIVPADTTILVGNFRGKNGEIVVAKIVRVTDKSIVTDFVRSLGDKNAPGVDITRILVENDAPIDFPEAVEAEVQSLPNQVIESDLLERKDLREELIVTIDGETAKDFDDAVSIRKEKDGYVIGVHIADVSHYVKENTAIDKEAVRRGTSIYVTDRVVPMLPFALSNGICSLNPHVDRLTITCDIKVNHKGEVMHSVIYPSVINSKHRVTYTFANEVILRNTPENDLESMLITLDQVARKIRKNRVSRGSLDFDIDELKIEVDANGTPISIGRRERIESERLIEDLMILANEEVASTIEKRHLPFIYRIHELPSSKKLENFLVLATRFGIKSSFNPAKVTPLDLQYLLNLVDGKAYETIFSSMLLRSLAKARYAVDNKGHFGLASVCYTHFTSPIRRYPDLIVHRLLRRYLFEKNTAFNLAFQEKLLFLADDTSIKERRAITIERAANDMKAAEFMSKDIGEVFDGYIDGMSQAGLFVQMSNGISGMIRFDSLPDFYALDKFGQSAHGKRTHTKFVLGAPLKVKILATDKAKGQILLGLEKQKEFKGTTQKYVHKKHQKKRKK